MPTQSIPEQLASARQTITGSINSPEIRAALKPRGYDTPEFAHAEQLLAAAEGAVSAAGNAAGVAVNAVEDAQDSFADLKAALGTLRALARPALANDRGDLTLLGLTGAQPRTPSACATMLSTAHSGLASQPRLAERLAFRGYGPAEIAADHLILTRSQAAETAQAAADSDARSATLTKTAALAALSAWLKEYRAIARVALKAHPALAALVAGK